MYFLLHFLHSLHSQAYGFFINLKCSCTPAASSVVTRVGISGGKFPVILIYSEISRNLFITYVSQLFPGPALQSDAAK